MRESPRVRRLRSDLRSLEKMKSESTILDFSAPGPMFGGAPEVYRIRFHGVGVWRADQTGDIHTSYEHEVNIELGASYPRMMPALSWRTPIFHPNISGSGVVCLGGYGTHWSPSLGLDELCEMLWDMIRYKNFDVNSPYNREAAHWAKMQRQFAFPIDDRPIRDRVASGAIVPEIHPGHGAVSRPLSVAASGPEPEMIFLGETVVEAEIVKPRQPEILFIE